MPIRNNTAINTDERSDVKAPATLNAHGPTLLAEAELDHVAAAGAKGGHVGEVRHPAGRQ